MSRKINPRQPSPAARLLICLLAGYKRLLSPLLGSRCRFHPSCSTYTRDAILRHGAVRGVLLGAWRLLRCQPWCSGGNDPVPETFRFPPCRRGPPHEHPDPS